MEYQVVNLECPGCGRAININTKKCPQCFREIIISSFSNLNGFSALELNKHVKSYNNAIANCHNDKGLYISLAFCYLKLKLYDKAITCFEKVMEDSFDNSEIFFMEQ